MMSVARNAFDVVIVNRTRNRSSLARRIIVSAPAYHPGRVSHAARTPFLWVTPLRRIHMSGKASLTQFRHKAHSFSQTNLRCHRLAHEIRSLK